MNREEFLKEFADILQTDETLSPETILDDLEEWDSLSKIATIALFDRKIGKKLTFLDITNLCFLLTTVLLQYGQMLLLTFSSGAPQLIHLLAVVSLEPINVSIYVITILLSLVPLKTLPFSSTT